MPDSPRTVTFDASFPHKANAVDFHGQEGARITLDIPETCKPQALMLPAFFLSKPLKVTIQIGD